MLLGVGVYVLFLGVLGIKMVRRRSEGLVTFYSVAFFVLLALHAAIAIGFLFYESKTISVLQDLNKRGGDNADGSEGENGRIQSYLDDHRDQFKIASVCVLAVELITFCMAVCCQSAVSGAKNGERDYTELDTVLMDDRQTGLLSSPANYTEVSATPQTDLRREAMREKYGDRIGASSSTRTTTSFSSNTTARA